jgi:hypothetical protein
MHRADGDCGGGGGVDRLLYFKMQRLRIKQMKLPKIYTRCLMISVSLAFLLSALVVIANPIISTDLFYPDWPDIADIMVRFTVIGSLYILLVSLPIAVIWDVVLKGTYILD